MLTTQWTEGQFRVQRPKWKEGNKDSVPHGINQQVVCGVKSSASVRCTRTFMVLHVMTQWYLLYPHYSTQHDKRCETAGSMWFIDPGTCSLQVLQYSRGCSWKKKIGNKRTFRLRRAWFHTNYVWRGPFCRIMGCCGVHKLVLGKVKNWGT